MAASHHLSPLQLGSLADRLADPEQAGFSARAFGPGAGEEPPANSYMVATPGQGQNNMIMPVSAEEIGSFANSRTATLRPEGRYLGGWSVGKEASLDVSQAYPFSQGHQAMNQGIAGNEIGIGMIGRRGQYVGTMPVVDPRKLLTDVKGLQSRVRLLGKGPRPALGPGLGGRSGPAR